MNRCQAWRRAAMIVGIGWVLTGCDGARREPTAPVVSFDPPRSDVFIGAPKAMGKAFNAVSADMDLDGDPDLLINWHILAPLELFENVDGGFRLLNPPGAETAGLFENRGVPWLYGPDEEIVPRIVDRGRPGIYVWHDVNRKRIWNLVVVFDPGSAVPVSLTVEGNRPVRRIAGLDDSEVERIDPFRLRVRLAPTEGHRFFRVGHLSVATQLKVAVADDRPGPGLGFFAGTGLIPVAGETLELWKPDPHGIAWADVAGSPLPDLFITRGGIQGTLQPPHDPKSDQLFVAGAGPPISYRQADDGVVPRNYGRGRQVEWVDVDNDGRPELYIGNRSTPNTLLAFDPESRGYRDVAPRLNLDFDTGQTFAWLDLDDDGYQDLLVSRGSAIAALRNLGGSRFEELPGSELGLELPASARKGIFSVLALQLADFNNDGRLDLLTHGSGQPIRLFLRGGGKGDGFVDATTELGLAGLPGCRFVLLLDADNDGWEDLVSVGGRIVLLKNNAAAGFEAREIAPGWAPKPVTAGTVLDADMDGRDDLVLVSNERNLMRNSTTSPGGHLRVAFDGAGGPPVGALARAFYSDGSVKAQRYGSAHSAAYSQALRPLHFGVPRGVDLEAVEVTWPAGLSSRHPVRKGQETLRPARPAGVSRVDGTER